jgi:hypothetical protein
MEPHGPGCTFFCFFLRDIEERDRGDGSKGVVLFGDKNKLVLSTGLFVISGVRGRRLCTKSGWQLKEKLILLQ